MRLQKVFVFEVTLGPKSQRRSSETIGGFSQRANCPRLKALHSCPHATITRSPMGGGT